MPPGKCAVVATTLGRLLRVRRTYRAARHGVLVGLALARALRRVDKAAVRTAAARGTITRADGAGLRAGHTSA